MSALLYPWIVLALVVLGIITFLCRIWKVGCVLLTISFFLNWWTECFPLNLLNRIGSNTNQVLKVISFNIEGTRDIKKKPSLLFSIIKKYDPDLLFISEFPEQEKLAIDTLLPGLFHYTTRNGQIYFQYFYSKYPLYDESVIRDSTTKTSIGCSTCKLDISNKTISLYGCHLISNNYTAKKNA